MCLIARNLDPPSATSPEPHLTWEALAKHRSLALCRGCTVWLPQQVLPFSEAASNMPSGVGYPPGGPVQV